MPGLHNRLTRPLPTVSFAQRSTIAIALAFACSTVVAQTTPSADPAPARADVPAPPPMLVGPNDERIEPMVTIRKENDREVEEYRIRGQLFAVRVKVRGAPAYWLIDPDGSGRMVPGQSIGPTIAVPKWVLREF